MPSLSAGGGRRWRAETKQPGREHEERKFIFLYKEKEGKKNNPKLNLRLIISRESTRVQCCEALCSSYVDAHVFVSSMR